MWRPIDNKKYETLSFLPPLTDAEVAKQVEYCVASGWTPCIEFECEKGFVYRGEDVMTAQPCHYDGTFRCRARAALPQKGRGAARGRATARKDACLHRRERHHPSGRKRSAGGGGGGRRQGPKNPALLPVADNPLALSCAPCRALQAATG